MEKLYFENEDSENAYDEQYFQEVMKADGLTEIEVFEAVPVPESEEQYVYCREIEDFCEKKECNIDCEFYKASCTDKCQHKGSYLEFGDTVILKKKE